MSGPAVSPSRSSHLDTLSPDARSHLSTAKYFPKNEIDKVDRIANSESIDYDKTLYRFIDTSRRLREGLVPRVQGGLQFRKVRGRPRCLWEVTYEP